MRKIFYWILIGIGALGIAATVVAACVSTGIGIGTVLPGCAGIVLIAYGVLHLKHPGPVIRNRIFRRIVVVIVCIGLLSFAAIETVITVWANTAAPEKNVNFVIVLGCGIFPDGELTRTLQNRLDGAYGYLETHKDALCIVSGGQGADEPFPEADAMKGYLMAKGIDQSRIVTEARSSSTEENLAFSLQIMEQDYPQLEKTVLIATSGYHVFRARLLAKTLGMDAYGLPCATPWPVFINGYMREYLSVINMAVFHIGGGVSFLRNG